MLLSALIAISLAKQHTTLPFKVILKTEAKSPHPEMATLLQSKRMAFDFLLLVKDGSPKPHSLMKTNWRKSNVLIVYPGFVQRDSRISMRSVKRLGKTVQVVVDWHKGLSTEAYYPIYVLTIPKQAAGAETKVIDPNRVSGRLRASRF